jgi:BirA family biotin operon repressor/biotin-[acetyl-CoA-carboxylase] ligase
MNDVPEFAASAALASVWRWMPHTGSTNEDLSALARSSDSVDAPDFTVFATDDQRAGRGRLGRDWVNHAGGSLAASVLIRPRTPSGRALSPASWGWYPLLAGLAMTRALAGLLPRSQDARLKWPNDVLIETPDGTRKVCGILCELVTDASGEVVVVVGSGINLALTRDELPVETATSLQLVGASATDVDTVLSSYLAELRRVTRVFEAAEGDAVASGLRDDVLRDCDTLGRRVRVDLPDGSELMGTAESIDAEGQLVIALDSPANRAGERISVSSGDVTHVRVV